LTTESTVAGLESCGSAEAVFTMCSEAKKNAREVPTHTHTHDQLIHFVIAAGADLQSVYFSLHRLWDHGSKICDRQNYIVCSLHK